MKTLINTLIIMTALLFAGFTTSAQAVIVDPPAKNAVTPPVQTVVNPNNGIKVSEAPNTKKIKSEVKKENNEQPAKVMRENPTPPPAAKKGAEIIPSDPNKLPASVVKIE